MSLLLKFLLTFRIATALILVTFAVLGWTVFDWPDSLNIAIVIIAAFILIETAGSYIWERPVLLGHVQPDETDVNRNAFADAAKIAISTQGVVLGLVSFSDAAQTSTTVKIGAASLVGGVLTASVLYMLVVGQPPPDERRGTAASLLLAVALWMLGFGLLCVVAGSWSAPANPGGGTP